jgi:beta-glucanase (GH16 family)
LNDKVWNIELGDGCPNYGWGNNERQLYTNQNHRLEKGNLVITAKKDEDSYTSTRINTKTKKEFQYRGLEARAQLPLGHGLWPAFWMLGSNLTEKKLA